MKIRRTPDSSKMKELILHVAEMSQSDDKFGSVKLNKILFFADFVSYLKRGKSISDQKYFALDEGPAPQQMKPIKIEMEEHGDIAIKKTAIFGVPNPMERVVALRPPDYAKLDDAEGIAIVDQVITKLRDKNGKQVSDLSHRFVGWEIAYAKGQKTIIPYDMARFDLGAFFGMETPDLPEHLVEYGRRLYRKVISSPRS